MEKTYSGIILKTAYGSIGETANLSILGKTLIDWVKLALSGADNITVADDIPDRSVVEVVKPHVNRRANYVVVLYSDTPLITKKTVEEAVDEAYNNGKAVLKMTRGFVFETNYILNADKIYTENTFYFDEEDFMCVYSYSQLCMLTENLRVRILNYHMEQGVLFTDLGGTMIGCDVSIEKGVTIGSGNVITGRSKIRKNAVIGNNNVIEDSIIGAGAEIENSHIVKSSVGAGSAVGPYASLSGGAIVGEKCRIGSNAAVENSRVGDGTSVGSGAFVGGAIVGAGCKVGASVTFSAGQGTLASVVGDGTVIGAGATVVSPANIGSGATVGAGSVVTGTVLPAAQVSSQPGDKEKGE